MGKVKEHFRNRQILLALFITKKCKRNCCARMKGEKRGKGGGGIFRIGVATASQLTGLVVHLYSLLFTLLKKSLFFATFMYQFQN
jgi:hypothetical protein